MRRIPPIDAGPGAGDMQEKHEFCQLEADNRTRENLFREADQRYSLRRLAVAIVLAILLLLFFVLLHMSHKIFFWSFITVSPAYAMTLIIAPIASMSALAMALLVAAFRGFKKDDEETTAGAAASAMRSAGTLT
jgi:hypothetical protein